MSFAGRNFGGRVQERYTFNRNTRLAADVDSFSRVNFVAGTTLNSTLQAVADANNGLVPVGVLGSSVVVTKGNGIAGPPSFDVGGPGGVDLTERPLGVIVNDAAGNPFESVNLSGAGVHVFIEGPSTMDIALWETNERLVAVAGGAHTAAVLTYAAGDQLFVDTYSGLLTKVLPLDSIGNDFSAPALFDPALIDNGVYPQAVAIVEETSVGGGPFMLIRWLM